MEVVVIVILGMYCNKIICVYNAILNAIAAKLILIYVNLVKNMENIGQILYKIIVTVWMDILIMVV